jgi:hypothetical protein
MGAGSGKQKKPANVHPESFGSVVPGTLAKTGDKGRSSFPKKHLELLKLEEDLLSLRSSDADVFEGSDALVLGAQRILNCDKVAFFCG